MPPIDHADRMARAAVALDGLSVGDALGQCCFHRPFREALLADAEDTPPMPWEWTDDTAMAVGIYEVLGERGDADPDALARRFAARYAAQPHRGYGAGAHRLLTRLHLGDDWRSAARTVFPGGSFGNGSAMRVAPLAGYFAQDDYGVVIARALDSARVTHAHPEGLAGAIAAAVAGAFAWKHRDGRADPRTRSELFDAVLDHTPAGDVRKGIEHAALLPAGLSPEAAARLVGNGSGISCQDTLPLCVWAAAAHLDDYAAAIRTTIAALGDVDTNAAIVGGIVALAVGREGIPAAWLAGREGLATG